MSGLGIFGLFVYIFLNFPLVLLLSVVVYVVFGFLKFLFQFISEFLSSPLTSFENKLAIKFKPSEFSIESKFNLRKNKVVDFFGGYNMLFAFLAFAIISLGVVVYYLLTDQIINLAYDFISYTVIGSFIALFNDFDNINIPYIISIGLGEFLSFIFLKHTNKLHYVAIFLNVCVSVVTFSFVAKFLNGLIDVVYKWFLALFSYIKVSFSSFQTLTFWQILLVIGAIIVFLIMLYLGALLLSVGLTEMCSSVYCSILPMSAIAFVCSVLDFTPIGVPLIPLAIVIIVTIIIGEFVKVFNSFWEDIDLVPEEEKVNAPEERYSFGECMIVSCKSKKLLFKHVEIVLIDNKNKRHKLRFYESPVCDKCINQMINEEIKSYYKVIADESKIYLICGERDDFAFDSCSQLIVSPSAKYFVK